MQLKKRVAALEKRLTSEPVVLYFEDGSTKEIRGPKNFLYHLFLAMRDCDLTPEQSAQLELIRKSVAVREPGGAHLSDLVRCFADFPFANPPDDPEEGSPRVC